MKKYIVGENGKIYDKFGIDLEKEKVGVLNCYYIEEEYCRILYEKEDFDKLKQGDTIEELCDEFILFDDENKIHYQSQEGSIWWLGAGLYPKSVRGAIFTDEGIKYVAKLNENNELELI